MLFYRQFSHDSVSLDIDKPIAYNIQMMLNIHSYYYILYTHFLHSPFHEQSSLYLVFYFKPSFFNEVQNIVHLYCRHTVDAIFHELSQSSLYSQPKHASDLNVSILFIVSPIIFIFETFYWHYLSPY